MVNFARHQSEQPGGRSSHRASLQMQKAPPGGTGLERERDMGFPPVESISPRTLRQRSFSLRPDIQPDVMDVGKIERPARRPHQ
jgi:hypothetical protein